MHGILRPPRATTVLAGKGSESGRTKNNATETARRFEPAAKSRRALFLRLALRVRAIGEARVAEPGSDRHHAPMLDVLHEGQLAQSLHYGVVVHEDRRLMLAD